MDEGGEQHTQGQKGRGLDDQRCEDRLPGSPISVSYCDCAGHGIAATKPAPIPSGSSRRLRIASANRIASLAYLFLNPTVLNDSENEYYHDREQVSFDSGSGLQSRRRQCCDVRAGKLLVVIVQRHNRRGSCRDVAVAADTTAAPPGDPILVVTTTTQLTDFVTEIGGPDVRVVGLLKANVDPHDFEPSPADLDDLAKVAVIVKNGVGLEKWFDATIKSAEPKGTIVDASAGVKVRAGDDEEPEGDPHIWHNPQNAKIMVRNIADALAIADPAHADAFTKNLADYSAKLEALDAEIALEWTR